jgi:hypothetical protein
MDRLGRHIISERGHPVQSDLSVSTKNGSILEGALERHYSAKEIAELWGLCENSVRELFM